jgi:phosphoribosylformimino-5-aminoimidazole carboxamide ribotide isomerase
VILYPAVDILAGQAVRLRQGDYGSGKVYADTPLDAARHWAEEGARAIHLVDLDGAKEGRPVALEHLRQICAELALTVQYGGGLRSVEHVGEALDAGASRVVLGTAAFTDPELLDDVLRRYGGRVAVAVDVRGGRVTTSGWLVGTATSGDDAVLGLRERGVRNFVYTNVDRDGMMGGPNPAEVAHVSELVNGERFLYSGGIGSIGDLLALARLGLPNLDGVIVGKALFERRFTVAEGIAALGGEGAREIMGRPARD